MIEHKAWAWDLNRSDRWHTPSEVSYYLVHRWNALGFRRFLDLGCGIGRHSIQFAKEGFDTFAFDLSDEAIRFIRQRAVEKHLDIKATPGNMIHLPYEDNFFDCVLAYHVISHTDSAGIKLIVSEIERTLRPGGEFYVSLCSKNAWSFKEAGFPVIDENTVIKREDGPEDGIPHFFADEDLIGLLFSGFKVLNLKHIQDLMVQGERYVSWHFYIHGCKPEGSEGDLP